MKNIATEKIFAILIIAIVMLLIGWAFVFHPEFIRKYDMRETLYIKNKDEYIFTTRIFGLITEITQKM